MLELTNSQVYRETMTLAALMHEDKNRPDHQFITEFYFMAFDTLVAQNKSDLFKMSKDARIGYLLNYVEKLIEAESAGHYLENYLTIKKHLPNLLTEINKSERLTLEEQVSAKQIEAEQYDHAYRLHLAVHEWPSVLTAEEEQEKSENFEKCLIAIKELYFDCYWWRVFEGVGLKPLGALSVLHRRRVLQEYAEHRNHPILESIKLYPAW